MNENEIKQRISSVLRALDNIQVSGFRNVQNLAWSMSVLDEITKAPIEVSAQEE